MRKLLFAVCLSTLVWLPSTLLAQVDIGAQGSWGDESHFGVGARLTIGIPTAAVPIAVIGSFDWFFPSQPTGIDLTYWEANGNVVFLFPIRDPRFKPYGGLGLNVARSEAKVDPAVGLPVTQSSEETNLGLNLLMGALLDVGKLKPYGEARFQIEGGKQLVLTAGVNFQIGEG